MAISASDVKVLREKTGAGMMDCKKALEDTNGNFEESVKLIKERGLAVVAKKAERIAAEGLVDILYDENSKTAVMVEVNTETDFVARNESFQNFVKGCLKVILKEKPTNIEDLMGRPFGESLTVDDALKELAIQIKENMTVRRFAIAEGNLCTYIHNKGAIGVIVKVDGDKKVLADGGFAEFKKNLALQIASMNPDYISKEDVPASVIESEKEQILAEIKEDAANAKKPENVIEKMVDGKIRKYYDTKCLLQQDYVKEDKSTVAEYIESYKKQVGGEVKVAEFYRFEKGEGIQKKEENFAEEIAKLTGNK
ncbi:MAG: translation elongation factor Ts [Oscillospiraceae bacterium]|nr:translation elongation factor Ts [Oscillospiraceae bacterium]